MNYYELTFTYTSPVETSIINDVLAAELGEIGFESFAENENGLQGYISDQLYNVKGLQDKLAEFPLENVDIHFTETLVESKDWNEEWEKNYFKPIRIGKDCIIRASFHEHEPGYAYNIIIDPKMATTRPAPFIWARMASTAVPQPMSSSSLLVRYNLSISLIIRKVVSWLRNSRTGHPCP